MATIASHIWRPSASRVLLIDGFVAGPRGMVSCAPTALRWPSKDPADVLDYQFDIAPALAGNDGDALATLDVVITPSNDGDVTLLSSGVDGTRAVVWLQAGNAGTTYTITLIIGTETGRSISRSILLPVVALASSGASNLPLTTEAGTTLVDSDGNALLLGVGSV